MGLMRPIGLILLALTAASSRGQEHTKDSLETIKKAVAEKKAILVDVRELTEWKEGHIRGALLLPLNQLRKENVDPKELANLPKNKVLYCHCKSGRRCLIATDILRKWGYDARAVKPGYKDLIEAGFPKDD